MSEVYVLSILNLIDDVIENAKDKEENPSMGDTDSKYFPICFPFCVKMFPLDTWNKRMETYHIPVNSFLYFDFSGWWGGGSSGKGKRFHWGKCRWQIFLQSCARYIRNLIGFNENLDLKEKLTLLFGYFQQDNYKIEFLAKRLGTRLQFEYLISFHPNSLIS